MATAKKKKKKPPLGTGERFAAFKGKLQRQGLSEEAAAATAAQRGREKYGQAKMTEWSVKGRKRAAKKRAAGKKKKK